MNIIETNRLILRWVEVSDAAYILKLLNEPGWIQFIGDKGIRTLDDARSYITSGPRTMYKKIGFGLFLTELKEDHTPIGLCGLIKREGLEDVDIGFAFSEDYHGQGYALEAAQGTMKFAKELGLKKVVAITSHNNHSSSKLLEKIGMKFEGFISLPGDSEELKYYKLHF
ncbi:GNAT family N-acetyltransferase [Rossellomorea aquimaris]|uniref:GNAT family N-acetyltransferase n=1 Tax=Rossellomorea aquimaris TaxID=189382 RepID=UPI0007D05874|nr:GNAT family N-acetyltransferase [Rossellomorea aquimaris]